MRIYQTLLLCFTLFVATYAHTQASNAVTSAITNGPVAPRTTTATASGQCGGVAFNTNGRTQVLAGQQLTLNFKALHNNGGTWRIAFSADGSDAGFANNVLSTTVADVAAGTSYVATIPSTTCPNGCSLQAFYPTLGYGDCWDITIVAAAGGGGGGGGAAPTSCPAGWSGPGCVVPIASASSGAISELLLTTAGVTAATFNRQSFATSIALALHVDPSTVSVVNVAQNSTTVSAWVQIWAPTAAAAGDLGYQVQAMASSNQLNGYYSVSRAALIAPAGSGSDPAPSSGGSVAAGILIPLFLIGGAIGGVWFLKNKRPETYARLLKKFFPNKADGGLPTSAPAPSAKAKAAPAPSKAANLEMHTIDMGPAVVPSAPAIGATFGQSSAAPVAIPAAVPYKGPSAGLMVPQKPQLRSAAATRSEVKYSKGLGGVGGV